MSLGLDDKHKAHHVDLLLFSYSWNLLLSEKDWVSFKYDAAFGTASLYPICSGSHKLLSPHHAQELHSWPIIQCTQLLFHRL
jgi:hypothetical protein